MKSFLYCIFLVSFIVTVRAFFINLNSSEDNSKQSTILRDFKIEIDRSLNNYTDSFPPDFTVCFSWDNKEYDVKFAKISSNSFQAPGIYVLDSNGHPKKYDSQNKNEEKFEQYKQTEGSGLATLIRNENDQKNPFRMMATVYVDDKGNITALNLVPVVKQTQKSKRSVDSIFDSFNNLHAVISSRIIKPSITTAQSLDRLLEQKIEQVNLGRSMADRRAGPRKFNIETLIVTDLSVLKQHQDYAKSTDNNLVFQQMKIYFSHVLIGVNQRFQNSLQYDPDIRINVRLNNFLFLTSKDDAEWANPELVGEKANKTFNGREVILSEKTYKSFVDFMNSREFEFDYDYAIGVFNKDLWLSDSTLPEQSRSAVNGYSALGKICTDQRYAIVEEFGSFTSILNIAREMGHSLGSGYDGSSEISSDCPMSENHIMVEYPSFTFNSVNLLRFSSCSLIQFKRLLLESNGDITQQAQCLTNVPYILPGEFFLANSSYPGQIWSANDQCQMLYGKSASFCQHNSVSMCASLFCRSSSNESSCIAMPGGAAEGTSCDSGKICIQGACVESKRAPMGECIFGDDVVTQEAIGLVLPGVQMSCQDVLDYVVSQNQSASAYCSNSNFRKICCNTCRKYDSVSCTDKFFDCPRYPSLCASGKLNGVSVKILCPRTCNVCTPDTLFCTDDHFMCKNGGVCKNTTATKDGLFGFKCECKDEFTGDLCQIKNPCSPNPCSENAKCQRLGSLGFVCHLPDTTKSPTTLKVLLTKTTSTTKNSDDQFLAINNQIFNKLHENLEKKLKLNEEKADLDKPQTQSTKHESVSTTTKKATSKSSTDKLLSDKNIRSSTLTTILSSKTPTTVPKSTSKSTKSDVASNLQDNKTTTQPNDKLLKNNQPKTKQNDKEESKCRDFNKDVCEFYASKNLCSDHYYINGKQITIECAKSCLSCV